MEFVKKFRRDMQHTSVMTDLRRNGLFSWNRNQAKAKWSFHMSKEICKWDLKKFRMKICKETTTPTCQKEKLSKNDEAERVDETLYKTMVDSLMYLVPTRPNILHAVSLLSSSVQVRSMCRKHILIVIGLVRRMIWLVIILILVKGCFLGVPKSKKLWYNL